MQRNTNIGRRIGRYEIIEEIGKGGMAVVYRALDTTLKREVALKLLHPHLASHIESRKRFRREAQAVSRLKHPAILETYDYSDEEGEDIFIAMELVEGTTLRQLLDDQHGKPLPGEVGAMILRQISAALAHVHESNVVHRDIKPENILIGPKGNVKLSDFGIAHLARLSQMTVTGQILGSPAYMSPEHIEKADPDTRADIFSIGTVLYEATVGQVPFDGSNPHAIIKKIVEGKFIHPLNANPKLEHHLAKTIAKCLVPNPDDRYQTAKALMYDLDRSLETIGITAISDELAAYFSNPEQWWAGKIPNIIAQTLDLGLASSRSGQHTLAIDHFNRVLALEPGNEKALAATKSMYKKRRINRALGWTAITVSIVIAIAAGVWASNADFGARRSEANNMDLNGDQAAIQASPDARPQKNKVTVFDAGAAEPAPSVSTSSPKVPSRRITAKREIVFTPSPMAVTIVIDGKKRFLFGPTSRKQLVAPGRHTISFIPNDEKRFVEKTWKINVPPGNKPFHFRERLRWRPATLMVRSDVAATVTIPGRATHTANKLFKVSIKNGPKEKITVLVSADGYMPITKQVSLTAGEQAELAVVLIKKE
jgi:serine/threonine-protein kinase